jgi:lipooligosaccharide transport system permease protein
MRLAPSPTAAAQWADPPMRAFAVFARNVAAARHPYYLWVLLSGLFEPAFYLFSLGLGVGKLIGTFDVNGQPVRYAAYIAPAMLAAAVMNGAVAESTFNFFAKLRMMRLHDATACTPVTAGEVVSGELMWSMARGAVHSIPFLGLMRLLGLVETGRLPALFLATLLTSAAFGAMGLAVSTVLRGTYDFDKFNLVTFTMFIFSGTFVPVTSYPGPLAWLCKATPLWQAVALLRDLTARTVGAGPAFHALYLVAIAAVAWKIASHRMEVLLRSLAVSSPPGTGRAGGWGRCGSGSAENRSLQEQIARHLGLQRAQRAGHTPAEPR